MLSEPPTDVHIQLLGSPRWRGPGHGLTPLSRKDAALLTWLALDGELERDRVAAWLWPDTSLANAKLNLRQRLFKLRQLCGRELFVTGTSLRLAAGVQVDVTAPGPVPDGPLLGSFDYGDLGAFDDWVQAARQRITQRQVDRLAGEAAQLEAQGALAAAIELCQRIVGSAPWHEHSWRRLMRLHYLRGDRTAAVATFHRFEQDVCAEQGCRPAAETLELLRTIESNDPRRSAGGPLPASLVKPPRLVGREHALQALQAARAAGRAVLVLGDAGIGKSHLLQTVVRGQPGVLLAPGRPGDAGSPYATLARALRQALDLFAPTLDPGDRQELARLLPALGDAGGGPGRQPALWSAVEHLLQACRAQGLTTLLIDDLHWADPASLELLRWLLTSEALRDLFMAFGARPDEPGPAAALLAEWARDPGRVETVRLPPWQAGHVQDLLSSLQLTLLQEAGPGLADALHRHAGGHPFDTLETLKALVLAGERPDALPHPPAVGARIQSRLRRLSAPALDLLRVAALSGDELPVDVASQVLGRPAMALAEAWLELETAQVLQGTRFAHDLVREAALALVPQALRPPLHAQLALALQARPGISAAHLAHHWWQAGRWPEAADQLCQAATAAYRTGRLAEHQTLLTRAAQAHDLAGDADAGFDARCQALGSTLIRQGEGPALAGIDELQPQARSDEQRARLDALRAEALLNLMQYDDALAASARALRLAPPDSVLAADAVSLHGRALALTGRTDEGVLLLERACAQATASGDPARELTAAAALAHALTVAGRRNEAFAVQQRVVRLAQARGDDTDVGAQTANLATLAYMTGRAEAAWRSASDAARRLNAMGAEGVVGRYNTLILARSGAALGRLDESTQVLLPLLDAGHGEDGSNITTQVRATLCTVWLWAGQTARALEALPTTDPAAHPLALAGLRLNRLRAQHLLGADTHSAWAALQAMNDDDPALFDEPVLCLEFTRYGPAADALERLRRVQAGLRRSGCEGTLRSLAVRQVQRLLDVDPAAAARMAQRLHRPLVDGLHPTTYPPEAWWTLCEALALSAPAAAEACRQRALDWIHQASLPGDVDAAREAFHHSNPLNRVVLGSLPITPR